MISFLCTVIKAINFTLCLIVDRIYRIAKKQMNPVDPVGTKLFLKVNRNAQANNSLYKLAACTK